MLDFGSFINVHFTTLFLILLCGIKLHAQKKARDVELRFFWLTLICCFLLTMEDILETITALDPALRFWRTLLSVIGYVLRPTAAVGLLLVVCPPERRSWKIWILCLVNLTVNMTAFFSPVAFSFDADYAFARGPLGYAVFVIGLLYMVQILALVWQRFYEGKRAERWILIICVVGCMAASTVDAFFGGCHLNEAMMIASMFLFVFLRSHDNYLDPLTSLRNRFAFYDDGEHLARDISAVASLDMNGLKKLNDTQGHAAGDRALTEIGRCISEVCDRNTIGYRVGGDEFVLLFLHREEEAVEKAVRTIKDSVAGAGYSISTGHAMKGKDCSLEDALQASDRTMYADKAGYYQQTGRDRRSRPRT
ncbi:MAG: GGDEF domain-containing protein [Clostridia bacterium]|nr:GGDEF domain-containing protein [Clostridia bacterium]